MNTDPAFELPKSVSDCLNLIGGASAQLVLFGHAISFLGLFPLLQPPVSPYLQNIGVVLFFFISGFVIAHTIKTKTDTWGQFVFERATRIFTALVPALLVVAAIDSIFSAHPLYADYRASSSLKTLVGNMLLLADYPSFQVFGHVVSLSPLSVDRFGTLRPIWSVVLEFWLYIFFGTFALYRSINARTIVPCIILFGLSLIPSLGGFTNLTGAGLSFVWLLGVAYYGFVRQGGRIPAVPAIVGLVLACALLLRARPLMALSESGYDLRYSLGCCLAAILAIEVYRCRPVGWLGKPAERLASFSFSLYLVHYSILAPSVIWLTNPRTDAEKIVMLVVLMIVSNLAAILFYYLFESRYRTVRRLLS